MTASRPIVVFAAGAAGAAFLLAGCESVQRVYSVDRERGIPGHDDIPGIASGLDWRIGERIERSHGAIDVDGNLIDPAVDADKALKIAEATLAKLAKTPADWKYAYCLPINFKEGCYGWSVRFDRREAFREAKAGDGLIKIYVLMDGSAIVPTTVYER